MNENGFSRALLIFFVAICIIIVMAIVGNLSDEDEYNHYVSSTLKLLSNPDNAEFDDELLAFAEKNSINLEIDHMDDLEAIEYLKTNSSDYDALWLSNSTWIYMLSGVTTLNSKSVNINPVVFGIKKSKAEELGFVNKDVYNKDIVNAIRDKKLKYVMSSVTKTNTGLIAYLGFLNALAGSPEILTEDMLNDSRLEGELKTLFSGVERTSGTEDFLEEMFLKSDDYEAVIATESSLIRINKELVTQGKEPLYLIYPVDGVAINDSPLAYIDNKQDKLELFNQVQSFVLSKESQDKLEKMGKRTWYGGVKANADSNSFKKEWGIDTTKYLVPLKYPSKDVMDSALALYIDSIRKPSVTAFCLDISGSMAGDGIQSLKDAMNYVLDYDTAKKDQLQFSKYDKIYIIPFESELKDTISTSNGRDTERMINSINDLRPLGGTNLYGCASEAVKIIAKENDDYTKTVILMTDGMPNLGTFNEFRNNYVSYGNGIPVYSIMFGSASQSVLNEIADLTNAKVFDGRVNLTAAFKEVRSFN